MEAYIPYLVIIAVVIVFFAICYALFSPAKGDKKIEEPTTSPAHEEPHKVRDYGATYYSNINRSEPLKEDATPKAPKTPNSYTNDETYGNDETYIKSEVHEGHYAKNPYETASNSIENTAVIPVVRAQIEETQMILTVDTPLETDDQGNETLGITQKIMPIPSDDGGEKNLSALEETRLINVNDVRAQLAKEEETETEVDTKKMVSPWTAEAQEQYMVNKAINPFLHFFGVVGDATKVHVEAITRHALQALHITTTADVTILLENIVIQEAILYMQKAYAANPTEWMHAAALEAFLDVVQQPKSSTPYLVAFDALRILPHMTLGHFQIMALSLLLQHSRNSNNYNMNGFKHYVEKYIEPFISDLPHDGSFYRQLEYLRCTIQEREPITLAQLLSNSYPFVFNYRGFTREELQRVMVDDTLDNRFIVKSLNSSLYKLALVDESMGPRFFRQARISDPTMQKNLISLICSKPTAFAGVEARNIMDDISPVLLDLADVFDNGPMASMSLTLLGLYIGRTHVKATIAEEFDLSRWF